MNLISEIVSISHEIGDMYSFCNPEEGVTLNSNYIEKDGLINVELKTGIASISSDVKFNDAENILLFNSKVKADIKLAMDFVFRLKFASKNIQYIIINKENFFHNNSNRYVYPNLLPGDTIIVNLKNGKSINIKFENFIEIDENWQLRPYIRDENRNWIIHFRFLPKTGSLYTKNCVSWYRSQPIPVVMQKFLDYLGYTKKYLYISEKSPRGPISRRILNLTSYYFANLKFSGEFKLSMRYV